MVELKAALERQGTHPYALPLTWSESAEDPTGDAELFGVDLAKQVENVCVRDRVTVRRLHVNPSGTEVRAVEAEIDGHAWLFRGDLVVLAAGRSTPRRSSCARRLSTTAAGSPTAPIRWAAT